MNIFYRSKHSRVFHKKLIFITGAPRSGTSLLTKVIDAHPKISILMENIFGNRRRHWQRAIFWNSPFKFRKAVAKAYRKIHTPILGNKVCMPDVWSTDDVFNYCQLFLDFRILFIVRNPVQVFLSRFSRGQLDEFSFLAKKNILLDFRSQFLTYASSWRQSIEGYWRLRDGFQDKVILVYYELLCENFEKQVKEICRRIDVPFDDHMLYWYKFPHHDHVGNLNYDLKYKDEKVVLKKMIFTIFPKIKEKNFLKPFILLLFI